MANKRAPNSVDGTAMGGLEVISWFIVSSFPDMGAETDIKMPFALLYAGRTKMRLFLFFCCFYYVDKEIRLCYNANK